MTKSLNIRDKKAPFTLVSSSVSTGYNAQISSSFKSGVDIANLHEDSYGNLEGAPAQGPFTETHVGGNQHRHVLLNDGTDDSTTREEAFIIEFEPAAGAVSAQLRVYGPDRLGSERKRASMLRGNSSKSPINVSNISSSNPSLRLGNYQHSYEVIQTSGRRINNRYFTKNNGATIDSTNSLFIANLVDFRLPDRTIGNTDSIIVERFNSPGGTDTTPRGVLDIESEEYALNNALPFRNLAVRQALQSLLTQHTGKAGQSSFTAHTASWWTSDVSASFYKVYNNPQWIPTPVTGGAPQEYRESFDTWYVQHLVPKKDLSYAWITASATTTDRELFGYQNSGSHLNRSRAFTDIEFVSASYDGTDFLGIGLPAATRDTLLPSLASRTLQRDRRTYLFDGSQDGATFPADAETGFTNFIDLGTSYKWNDIIGTGGSNKCTLNLWFALNEPPPGSQNMRLFDFSNEMQFNLNVNNFYGTSNAAQLEFSSSWSSNDGNWKADETPVEYGDWHMMTVTYDQSSPSNDPMIYMDGLPLKVTEASAPSGDVESFATFAQCFVGGQRLVSTARHPFSGSLAEFSVWTDIATPEEVELIWKASKSPSGFKFPPLPYSEHQVDRQHDGLRNKLYSWWSGEGEGIDQLNRLHKPAADRYNLQRGYLIKDVAGKNNSDAMFGDGVTRADSSTEDSLSVLYGGPYTHPIWKQLRVGESMVARRLRENNIISVENKPVDKTIDRFNKRIRFKPRRGVGATNYIEPPVSVGNKPMEHFVLLKGSNNPTSGHKITHTYANNLMMFANEGLNKALATSKNEKQMYDKLRAMYSDSSFPDEDNPIAKFLGVCYSETIFPRAENAFLAKTRLREDYDDEVSGYSSVGYDRNPALLRQLWKPTIEERDRTPQSPLGSRTGSIGNPLTSSATPPYNSQGQLISGSVYGNWAGDNAGDYHTSSWGGRSRLPIDKIGPMHSVAGDADGGGVSSKYGGELNALYVTLVYAGLNGAIGVNDYEAEQAAHGGTSAWSPHETNQFATARPRYLAFLSSYQDSDGVPHPSPTPQSSSDSGVDYNIQEMSGKVPFYESYSKFIENTNPHSAGLSLLSEFNMSEHMEHYVNNKGGDFFARNDKFLSIPGVNRDTSAIGYSDGYDGTFLKNVSISNSNKTIGKIGQDHKNVAKQGKLSFSLKGVKKLLPYNGFYPIERTVQLATLFSESYGPNTFGGNSAGGGTQAKSPTALSALLQPFFAPGIVYNMIKSGIAVDFPVFTGSLSGAPTVWGKAATTDFPGSAFGYTGVGEHQFLSGTANYRFPFESVVFPEFSFPPSSSADDDEGRIIATNLTVQTLYAAGTSWSYFERDVSWSPKYSLAMSNFLGEIPKMFLKDERLISHASLPQNKWKSFEASKDYYMDVVLNKTSDFVMMEAYHATTARGSYETGRNGEKMHGRYFGWPTNKYNAWDPSLSTIKQLIYGGSEVQDAWTDPAYMPYTPPYFESRAIARIKFSPSAAGKYTFEEIVKDATVENIFPDVSGTYLGSWPYQSAMTISSSVEIFGQTRLKEVEYDALGTQAVSVKDSLSTENDVWVISPRMETPTLDFSDQEIKAHDTEFPEYDDAVGYTGFGRGMWSGYGQIPEGSSGIFLEVAESFPASEEQGSLLSQLGFKPSSERVGALANFKTISEAVVAIPYLSSPTEKTIHIDGFNFLKLDENVYDTQLKNVRGKQVAVKSGEFGVTEDIKETTVSQMIKVLSRHVMPPRMDFLNNESVKPFAVYAFEFEHKLDKQDLADIWQGVLPTIGTTPELDEIVVSHEVKKYELLGEDGLPDGVQWLVFKIKKKAEKNYFAVTADSTDDDRFQFNFNVGRKAAEYSYNWPYDFFSLVELGKLDIDVEWKANDDVEKIVQAGGTPPNLPTPGVGSRPRASSGPAAPRAGSTGGGPTGGRRRR
jgi:hypothetical protein